MSLTSLKYVKNQTFPSSHTLHSQPIFQNLKTSPLPLQGLINPAYSTFHNPFNPQQKVIRYSEWEDDKAALKEEPVKKIKPDYVFQKTEPINGTIQPNKNNFSKVLTIDEVFNTPTKNNSNINHQNGVDETNLSFISDSDSLEILEEFPSADDDCMIIEPPIKNPSVPVSEPLTMKDTGSYSYPKNNFSPMIIDDFQATIKALMVAKNQQDLRLQPSITFPKISSHMNLIENEYIYKTRDSYIKSINPEPVKLDEDKKLNPRIFDSRDFNKQEIILSDDDSNDTGSTGLGLETRNSSALESIDGSRSQKETTNDFTSLPAEIFQDHSLPLKRGRGRPKKGEKVEKVEKKQKPAQKPAKKHKQEIKAIMEYNNIRAGLSAVRKAAARGLNRLQLLRYQESIPDMEEEEEVVRKVSIYNNNADSPDSSPQQAQQIPRYRSKKQSMYEYMVSPDSNIPVPIGAEHQVTIGSFKVPDNQRRRRAQLVPKWNPEKENQEELSKFLEELSKVIEDPITNQEKAFSLLKSFNMNVEGLFEAMREDISFYKDFFKVKCHKFRGCRLGY